MRHEKLHRRIAAIQHEKALVTLWQLCAKRGGSYLLAHCQVLTKEMIADAIK